MPSRVKGDQVRTIHFTDAGFAPKQLHVKVGVPVRLQVTRQTSRYGDAYFSVRDHTVLLALPLRETVEFQFTIARKGTITFGFETGSPSGILIAE